MGKLDLDIDRDTDYRMIRKSVQNNYSLLFFGKCILFFYFFKEMGRIGDYYFFCFGWLASWKPKVNSKIRFQSWRFVFKQGLLDRFDVIFWHLHHVAEEESSFLLQKRVGNCRNLQALSNAIPELASVLLCVLSL